MFYFEYIQLPRGLKMISNSLPLLNYPFKAFQCITLDNQHQLRLITKQKNINYAHNEAFCRPIDEKWHFPSTLFNETDVLIMKMTLKWKFPQTTMWIGWVERKFTNPTVKVWADLDNPFNSDYAKLCMSPSLDGTLPEYVISQEDNSPLTLYIDFHNF